MTPWGERQLRERERAEVAALYVMGETEPDALAGAEPRRVALETSAMLRQLPWVGSARSERRRRFAFVAWASEAWATAVYPDVKPLTAQRRLARDLLAFCRVGPHDPPGWEGLRRHLDTLERRARRLTSLGLQRLELIGPGTDLRLGIPPDALFRAAYDRNEHGRRFAANVPTEEVYTSPGADRDRGHVRVLAADPLPRATRRRPARRVPQRSSRASQRAEADRSSARTSPRSRTRTDSARSRSSTAPPDRPRRPPLLQRPPRRNAVTHMAFGQGFRDTRPPGSRSRGVNEANTHVDVMLGSDELDVTGVDARGRRIPLIRKGAWQV